MWEEIIFTKNATEAINLVASTYGEKFINKGDEILITELEHHANYVPWHFIRKKKGRTPGLGNELYVKANLFSTLYRGW